MRATGEYLAKSSKVNISVLCSFSNTRGDAPQKTRQKVMSGQTNGEANKRGLRPKDVHKLTRRERRKRCPQFLIVRFLTGPFRGKATKPIHVFTQRTCPRGCVYLTPRHQGREETARPERRKLSKGNSANKSVPGHPRRATQSEPTFSILKRKIPREPQASGTHSLQAPRNKNTRWKHIRQGGEGDITVLRSEHAASKTTRVLPTSPRAIFREAVL